MAIKKDICLKWEEIAKMLTELQIPEDYKLETEKYKISISGYAIYILHNIFEDDTTEKLTYLCSQSDKEQIEENKKKIKEYHEMLMGLFCYRKNYRDCYSQLKKTKLKREKAKENQNKKNNDVNYTTFKFYLLKDILLHLNLEKTENIYGDIELYDIGLMLLALQIISDKYNIIYSLIDEHNKCDKELYEKQINKILELHENNKQNSPEYNEVFSTLIETINVSHKHWTEKNDRITNTQTIIETIGIKPIDEMETKFYQIMLHNKYKENKLAMCQTIREFIEGNKMINKEIEEFIKIYNEKQWSDYDGVNAYKLLKKIRKAR